MAGRDRTNGNKQSPNATMRRRRMAILGGAVGAFAAAAAMATGSAVTAAPAKADFEDLLDPIIQPLLTSLTDAVAGFDPAAATDITSWTDSLLSSLNSIDLAVPSAAEPAAAAAAASPAASGPYDIPITMHEVTEPTIQATVGGANTTLLVDTGSSGLVVPYTDFGSNFTQQIDNILALGVPTGISSSGYSGGVDYVYLTYSGVSTDYGGVLNTTGPVDVEIYSFNPSDLTSFFTNDAFQNFDTANGVTGVLGIGADTAGPTTSPLENYGGVLVDIPDGKMVVDSANPLTPYAVVDGAPISTGTLTETVTTNGVPHSATIIDDVDSGGVYGTIPSSLASDVQQGSTITVSEGSTVLYSYQVGTDSLNQSEAPTSTTSTTIDSGIIPFLQHPIYIDYANDKLYFDNLT